MPKKLAADVTAKIETEIARHPGGAGIDDLYSTLANIVSRRTLQRRLVLLLAEQRIGVEGVGRAVRYRLATVTAIANMVKEPDTSHSVVEVYVPVSAAGEEIKAYVRQPIQGRKPVGYDRALLEAYTPNQSAYLPPEISAHLHNIGRTPRGPDGERPAGTYARDIMARLLIDLSWASSQLEGNTYSRLDTQNLIERGQAAAARLGNFGGTDVRSEGGFAGHARVEWPQQHIAQDAANILDFVLPPGRSIDGAVVTRSGRPIPDAFVRAVPDEARDIGVVTARSAADGSFRVRGVALGAVEFQAGAEGYRSTRVRLPADARGPVRIELDEHGAVAVTAIAASGDKLTEFTVVVRGESELPGSQPPARDPLRRKGPAAAAAQSLQDGALVLGDLEPGTWLVEVAAPGHAPTSSQPFAVEARATAAVTVVLQLGGIVVGRSIDERGSPVVNAIVQLLPPAMLGGELQSALQPLLTPLGSSPTCRTREDGRFSLANVPAREHRLVVQHPSFAPRLVSGVVSVDGAILTLGDVQLLRGAIVVGRALRDGEIDTSIVVQVVPTAVKDLLPGVVFEARVDRSGAFRIEHLPAGRYEVRAGRRLPDDPFAENADQARSRIEIDSDGTGTQTVQLSISKS